MKITDELMLEAELYMGGKNGDKQQVIKFSKDSEDDND